MKWYAALLPHRLATRFAILLSVAIAAAHLTAFALLGLNQQGFNRRTSETLEIERVVALVTAMESVAAPVRKRIAINASTRLVRVFIEATPRVISAANTPRSKALEVRVRDAVQREDIAVAVYKRPDAYQGEGINGREIYAISVPLQNPDGSITWLNVVTSGQAIADWALNRQAIYLALGISLVFVLGAAIWFSRRLTRPISQLARAAKAAGDGDHTVRLNETGSTEMREMASAFNTMQAEIARFETERKRTVAAVGHDLRTPITSLRIRAEMFDDEEIRGPFIRILNDMTVMAAGLVEYGKSGEENEPLKKLDLTPLLRDLCLERHIPFDYELQHFLQARPVALRRAFGNLMDNGKRYADNVEVIVSVIDQAIEVTINDNGPGIPGNQLHQVLEPFQRSESSRNIETGGVGLGLFIAHSIIKSHGGKLTLSNRPKGGLCVCVALASRTG